ncbi:MAG: DUF4198 domain-containing protein [Planctomycetaceae bacterium]|jgi:hypothetical protein|nr:DUF4198 domain-containing protein [Planctomycetaceae bacterium]
MNLLFQKNFTVNFIFSVIILVCCFAGCQKGIRVEMVEGVVTFEGKPVADADICFTPKNENFGIPAIGKTDSNGAYQLTSSQGGGFNKGAVAGEYDVRVMKYVDLDYVEPVNPQLGDSVPLANPKHHLPEKYADTKTSGLTATVKTGKNTINFDLTK